MGIYPNVVTRKDVDEALRGHNGVERFREALGRMNGYNAVVGLIARFVQFSLPFSAGATLLSTAIAARTDLFRDPEEPHVPLADRSYTVARYVFEALVDDFGDHRELAQGFLAGVCSHFKYTNWMRDAETYINPCTQAAALSIYDGYGCNSDVKEVDLFRALGFHLAAELLGDEEFRALNECLRGRHAKLVEYLSKQVVVIRGETYYAYDWVRVHAIVEADHADAGLEGINAALYYYCGNLEVPFLKNCILSGAKYFATVQKEFMANIL